MRNPGKLAALAIVLAAFALAVAPATAGPKRVMMVVWIGCEDVCRGVQDYFKENGIDVDFLVRDAAQDSSKFPGFVQEARAMKADLVLTWGTKTTLGIVGTLADRDDPTMLNDIPVVFTVVADPVGTKIIESYDKTGRPNVTGTRNRVPEEVNIKSIRRYLPGFNHLGVLYDPSEVNSVAKVEELNGLAGPLGFTLDVLPLGLDASGAPTIDSIKPQMDKFKAAGAQFIYLGSSNAASVAHSRDRMRLELWARSFKERSSQFRQEHCRVSQPPARPGIPAGDADSIRRNGHLSMKSSNYRFAQTFLMTCHS